MANASLPTWLLNYQQRIEQQLQLALTESQPEQLMQAMRYACLNGGKRIRAVLVYASANVLGADLKLADAAAVAIECIHAYSLIHDDLPAMDDDDLRRGKPSCHKAFNEATAILAGDALQCQAFACLADCDDGRSAQQALRQIQVLSKASGAQGMVGGQAIDLAATGKALDLEQLQQMHAMKTGALINASVEMASCLMQAPNSALWQALNQYASALGLAFQIKDDILDVESDSETLGKPQGADMALGKVTYVSLLGLDKAKSTANQLHSEALQQLSVIQRESDADTTQLKWLSEYIINRKS